MRTERTNNLTRLSLAACAVAFAATVGNASATDEAAALESIQRYCLASFRNAGIAQQDWSDCSQQVMVCLLERVSRKGLVNAIDNESSTERRELNRSIWCVVQRWRRAAKHVSLEEHEITAAAYQTPHDTATERINELLTSAANCLSDRQRTILSMCKDGWSVSEIADELGISPARASDEKYKAIRKLREQSELAVPA